VFYRVLFHYFDEFVAEYENRFEREYGYFRPIIQEVTAGHHEACKAVVISQCLTEGGEDQEGKFHKFSRFDESLIAKSFSREVFSMLLHEGLINIELVQKILRWRYTGFHVHSKVRTTSKREAERVGKYMIRLLLSLKRLSFALIVVARCQ